MPIQQPNLNPSNPQEALIQVRDVLRQLIQQSNTLEINQQIINKKIEDVREVVTELESMPMPSATERDDSDIPAQVRTQPLTGDVTGLLGLLSQPQHPYVPIYSTTPPLSDPNIQNGTLFLDDNEHLWLVDGRTEPFTYIDLTLAAAGFVFDSGTRGAKPAASATNANTFYFETDTRWLYFSTGAAWTYVAGVYFTTLATRIALTLVNPDDNNALAYDTDYGIIWRASAGAWVNFTFGALQVSITSATVNANVTTDQLLLSYNVPAGLLNVFGKTLRLIFSGLYDVDTATLVTWKIKLGGVTILSWTPITPAGLLTNLPFRIQAEISTNGTGATGTVEAHGVIFAEDKITAGHTNNPQLDLNTAVSAAIDLTAVAALEVTIAFNVASTNNKGIRRSMIIELMN